MKKCRVDPRRFIALINNGELKTFTKAPLIGSGSVSYDWYRIGEPAQEWGGWDVEASAFLVVGSNIFNQRDYFWFIVHGTHRDGFPSFLPMLRECNHNFYDLEDVLEMVSEDAQKELLFHLDVFNAKG